MKNFDNNQAVVVLIVMFVFGFAGPSAALVATTPSLGAAATYGVLSNIYTDTSGLTTVNGDIGFNVEPTTSVAGTHTNYGSGDPYSAAGIDQNNALSILNNHACTYTYTNGPIDISTNASRPGSTPGVFMPGVYCSIGAMNIGGPLTLSGNGTYIFKPLGALTSTNGSVVTLSGASACDVFWVPINETVLGANTTFAGTIIGNDANIFIGANTTFLGRALSFSRTVTTNTDTLTVPTCGAVPTPTPTPTTATQSSSASSSGEGYINIVKTVINDSGGTKTVTDFPLFVNGTQVGSGITNTFPAPAGIYTVTETGDANYVKTYSGACDVNGQLNLNPGDIKLCIITNDDIAAIVLPPPLIDVLKVPNPLALPNGPGPVTYTYTLRNIGIVPVTNVTMVGDTCSPIILQSGDTNSDSKLDVNETWVYSCTKNLTQTTTNIVTATGQANGITAVDTANATVVVGVPGLPDTGIVPPLIHVVKVPNVFVLPAGGGPVTYKYVVSNPGTVPLSNVSITDDKCTGLPGRVLGHSGDINQNNLLESNEAWSFTCKTSLTQTTINIGTAEGSANGMTAVDFSPATVVVAPLKLPNMGTTSGTSGTLTIGVEGDDVVTLQKTLEKKGFLVMPAGSAYGFFGSLTSIAVAKYQKSAGLPANGVFDLKTRAMLYADAANNIALPDAGTETNALIDTINKSGEVSAGIFVIFILIFLLILVVYKIIRQRGEN